jgi:hypothetical protein
MVRFLRGATRGAHGLIRNFTLRRFFYVIWAHFRRFAPETGLFGAPKTTRRLSTLRPRRNAPWLLSPLRGAHPYNPVRVRFLQFLLGMNSRIHSHKSSVSFHNLIPFSAALFASFLPPIPCLRICPKPQSPAARRICDIR